MQNLSHWEYCPFCQSRVEFEFKDHFFCTQCKNKLEDAVAKEESRPQLLAIRPIHPTAGSLIEIIYKCDSNEPPPFISVNWEPQHGYTSIRFKEGDWRRDSYGYAISIEVPSGSEGVIIRDVSKKSRQLAVKIEHQSTRRKVTKKEGLMRLFKFGD